VNGGAGVLHIVKNYTGDIMNFEMAAELARAEGIQVESVIINDDVAVQDSLYTQGRRGVGLTVLAEKICGAAAEAGADLQKVTELCKKVNSLGRTMGMALTSCTVPHVGKPTFDLPEDQMEIGIGIHGEPGRTRMPLKSADEITTLCSSAKDSTTNPPQYVNRTAVILGLASWKSGRTGGKSGGNGDALVQNNEITWASYPSWCQGWTWTDYVNYCASTSTTMYSINSAFRYRFGPKTFVNFLLENEPQNDQTSILWQTPEQPLRAVKDAVQAMVDEITALDSRDQMSLEIFGTTAKHEMNLSETLSAVSSRLFQMQVAHYDGNTNMGAGLQTALTELGSTRARAAAAKVIMLMSDGKPNIDASGHFTSGGSTAIDNWVKSLAQQAADRNMRLYTISVGADADQDLMGSLATIGRGEHFHAEGTPAEYADQLDQIFRTLGGRRPVQLIQ
jgi:uncharacterized protein YegL